MDGAPMVGGGATEAPCRRDSFSSGSDGDQVSEVPLSYSQWWEDGVVSLVQLVVRNGCVQIRRLVHCLCWKPELALFVQR